MKTKLFLIFVTLALTVFFHYFNQHRIMKLEKEYIHLEDELNRETQRNGELLLENNRLNSKERIAGIAQDKMQLVYPNQDKGGICFIAENPQDNTLKGFCLLEKALAPAIYADSQ